MSRFASLIGLSAVTLAGCGGNGALDFGDDPAVVGSAARGIGIERIALYQGVEVDIMDNREVVDVGAVSIVQNRDAMIRVFVETESDFEDREITGVLTVESGGAEEYFELTQFIDNDSDQGDIGSTLNFDVPAELMTADVRLGVSLQEVDFTVEFAGSDADAAWPEDEELHGLDTVASDAITIVVIPVRYNADGSGRTPDTSDAALERIRKDVQAMYPVTDVHVEVGQTLAWGSTIQAYGTGWSQLLQQIAYMRQSASGANANTYYYGLFNPASSMGQYCAGGCVAGLSLLGSEYDVWSRASIGLGYPDGAVETLVHEVGHAHGREHAPCQLYGQPSDPRYPHSGGGIGTWGYDMYNGDLKDPARYADMMGYCQPLWVSDYTYEELLVRVQSLSAQYAYKPAPDFDPAWRSISVGINGETELGPVFELARTPSGEPTVVEVEDANGHVEKVTGYLVPFDHIEGGILMVPEKHVGFRTVRLAGQGL